MRYLFLIIAILLPLIAEAQLTAPGMNAFRYATYPSAPDAKDPVFIYCNTSGSQKGELQAKSPRGTGLFNFSWYKWDDLTNSFSSSPIKSDNGVTISAISNLSEGGYRVKVSGGFDTTMTAWIFLDKPYSSAALQNRTCDYVALNGEAAIDTFYYKDPTNGKSIKLPDRVSFLWSSDPVSAIPYPDFDLDPQTFNPPLVNVTYMLQVSDSFGCKSNSSFLYESIHVKADFTADPVDGGAPLEVNFTNNSIRGYTYRWEFGDDSISELENPLPHIYYIPGEYTVTLSIESELHCKDSFTYPGKIKVDPSALGIPNVFSPDGDGINDLFRVESTSLKYLSVEIYSRSGMKVYSFHGDGDKLSEWQGWNGHVNNSSAKAKPGVYLYIIRAQGWDDVDYDSKEQRGFLYLYR
ncbi:MAG: gliding motility-associated C-terminal domain-containing protein [Bacteroidales bacterium]|nr:gliding motility-associated C-terminal domain-containing protein [Bacteroidales bacterium]